MKKSFIAILAISSTLFYTSCQKSPKQFEISGRVTNYEDGAPLKTTVSVFGDDVQSAKQQTEGSILFDKTETKDDGTFTLVTSRYSRGMYTLQIGRTRLERRSFSSAKKHDIGNFYSGTHTSYLRLTMRSLSDSSARVLKTDVKNDFYTFSKGDKKQVLLSRIYTGNKFFADSFFVVNYTTYLPSGRDSIEHTLKVPIQNLQDTLYTTIRF